MTPEDLARAACREPRVDPELFFPVGREDLWPTSIVWKAKAICAGCPIALECLRWANRTGQVYGIWGGQTPDERANAKRHSLSELLWRERHGDPDELLKEMARPVVIAGWAE